MPLALVWLVYAASKNKNEACCGLLVVADITTHDTSCSHSRTPEILCESQPLRSESAPETKLEQSPQITHIC